jgi:hypothetical protein
VPVIVHRRLAEARRPAGPARLGGIILHWLDTKGSEGDGRGADVWKIDLSSQSFLRNPFPALARMRQPGPVVQIRLPTHGKTWAATTHGADGVVGR